MILIVIKEKFNSNETPVAKTISGRVLTLPLYPKLKIDDVDRICDVVEGVGFWAQSVECL